MLGAYLGIFGRCLAQLIAPKLALDLDQIGKASFPVEWLEIWLLARSVGCEPATAECD